MYRFGQYLKYHILIRLCIYIGIFCVISNIHKIWTWLISLDNLQRGLIILLILLIIVCEIVFRKSIKRNKKDIVGDKTIKPLVGDQPTTGDKLGREEYVRLIGQKIFSTFVANNKQDKNKSTEHGKEDVENGTVSAYAINIEEDYGYGKTSFLLMLRQWFLEHNSGQYTWIEFKPWLCDNSSSLISEFFNQLAQETNIDVELHKKIINYGNALASQVIRYGTGLELSGFFKLHKSSLKSMHDSIREGLNKNLQLIVITIDDLDRLDKEEVLAVLKLIRATADFPNIFYITATEHTYLYNVLKSSGISDPDRYIEKFFNLHFYLPAHEVDYKGIFIELFDDFANTIIRNDNRNKEYENLKKDPILKSCFSDIRDVKRFINQLVIFLEALGNKDYNLYDATMLALLQYKSPELYKLLRDKDDIMLVSKKKVQTVY